MAKALKSAVSVLTKSLHAGRGLNTALSNSGTRYLLACSSISSDSNSLFTFSSSSLNDVSRRNHSSLSSPLSPLLRHTNVCKCALCASSRLYSSEVDKELSTFLDKEIEFESSRAGKDLPKISGFEITTDGGDVTLTKSTSSEKIIIRLNVNGAVDSMIGEGESEKQEEPPQMVCRPPFEVEISKGDGTVLAFQCAFPSLDDTEQFEDADQAAAAQQETIDDQFEIQEVAIHGGEWKNETFAVSAATLDAELFDLLMDMLDERGINDEFIAHLVDYCTAYENKKYIGFLKKLKSFVK